MQISWSTGLKKLIVTPSLPKPLPPPPLPNLGADSLVYWTEEDDCLPSPPSWVQISWSTGLKKLIVSPPPTWVQISWSTRLKKLIVLPLPPTTQREIEEIDCSPPPPPPTTEREREREREHHHPDTTLSCSGLTLGADCNHGMSLLLETSINVQSILNISNPDISGHFYSFYMYFHFNSFCHKLRRLKVNFLVPENLVWDISSL